MVTKLEGTRVDLIFNPGAPRSRAEKLANKRAKRLRRLDRLAAKINREIAISALEKALKSMPEWLRTFNIYC